MSFSAIRPFSLPYLPPTSLDLDDPILLKLLIKARAELAELNGYSMSPPNPLLLMAPFFVQESVASNKIENINTTVVEFMQGQLFPEIEQRAPDKEVAQYREALMWGRENLSKYSLSSRLITGIHKHLLRGRDTGYRKTQNKIENNATRETLYTPPIAKDIPDLIGNWEKFANDEKLDIDPLVKCALAHYQFEAIHPFLDGNGRTGRILMVLQLVHERLLNFPILFISGYLNEKRSDYYRVIHDVTAKKDWNQFITFMLMAFQTQAVKTKATLFEVMKLRSMFSAQLKDKCPSIYSSDLVDYLFTRPITNPVRLAKDMDIHYTTATKHLNALVKAGLLNSKKVGRYHLFMNHKLVSLLK